MKVCWYAPNDLLVRPERPSGTPRQIWTPIHFEFWQVGQIWVCQYSHLRPGANLGVSIFTLEAKTGTFSQKFERLCKFGHLYILKLHSIIIIKINTNFSLSHQKSHVGPRPTRNFTNMCSVYLHLLSVDIYLLSSGREKKIYRIPRQRLAEQRICVNYLFRKSAFFRRIDQA